MISIIILTNLDMNKPLYRKINCDERLPKEDGLYDTKLGELKLCSEGVLNSEYTGFGIPTPSRLWRAQTTQGYAGVYYPEWWLEQV